VRSLVYSQTEEELKNKYASLTSSETTKKYPSFIKHMENLWKKRKLWAHCFRKTLLIRGNHTNNYAEAGIKILKDIIFGRVKAYNLVQMFYFVVETMELYYKRKLVNIAHNRLESHIALRFQGINAQKIGKGDITKKAQPPGWYTVQSQTERGKSYDVNTHIGVCTCSRGQDGSPCSHQAAVVFHYGDESCNYISTLSASARLKIAKLALGESSVQDPSFYSSIHQKALQEQYGNEMPTATECSKEVASEGNELNFDGPEWDLIRAGARESDSEIIEDDGRLTEKDVHETCKKIDIMAETLKEMVQSNDPQLTTGVYKFLTRFNKLSTPRLHSRLATALHQFGWELGNKITTQAGQMRYGKRIAVQATAAGRRKQGKTRGKGKEIAGRPLKRLQDFPSQQSNYTCSRYQMPTRKEPKGRRVHSLNKNIQLGQQNAGKW